MALAPGTRLGSYEIIALLGAGGMGEVYHAHDRKLNRDVAIKILLPAVADDPDRLARFRREAQLLAALNHPGIAHIHGFEESSAQADAESGVRRAIVMELVEGPTLADRLTHGPIPVDEALPIAKQIAESLEAAHEQGIVHRDLKPANIKVRADGTVKVLDFGLAKALEPGPGVAEQEAAGEAASRSPTITSPALTLRGVILGTAAYMSPEQAKGRAVDRRADIWAFGCVLFEMLAGRRAFSGDDVTDTMVAVLSKEPAWHALPAAAAPVQPLIARCLRKDPKQRLQAIGDARIALDELLHGSSRPAAASAATTGQRRVFAVVGAFAAGAAAAAVVTWTLTRSAPAAAPPVSRFTIALPASQPIAFSFNDRDLALSADGRRLVFTAGARSQLLVRALDQLDAAPLPGIVNARAPFLSPDGSWIGFFDRFDEG